MSFITSVSNDFQIKNIQKTLIQTKDEINNICNYIIDKNIHKKLYISCINHCPISGIIDNIIDIIPNDKISLHLHISDDLDNLKKIINYALDNNINNFDISILHSGGCSVTIKKDELNNYLTYYVLYQILNY